ncbi:GNAT family N-acetyltransferase [Chitinophaga flava]|uniref:GNAT family N-acetyltransferase n=1 Tax=Chitinophaga flava TaxID=2259036 RepID=A0A365XXI1_9BACT|nr:GNAT family N-acetyltransferase [Chitinophaga flava]RBL90285.1 GNAT family N-acetyltransferase [Chitinophaga flava]
MRIHYQNSKIVIREFLPAELSIFCKLFKDDSVTRYLPFRTPEQYIEAFHDALEDYKKGPFGRWGIFDAVNNDFIGMCLARFFADMPSQVEIGYTLSQAYWGKGIATESSKALVDYCFTNTDTHEVVAVTDLDNIGSQKVLEKAGLRRVDNLKRGDIELAYFMIRRSDL